MRQPKPFYRQQTQSWYVQIGKRQVPLGKDEAAAKRKYHQLMLGRESNPSEPFACIVDEFLDWAKREKAEDTYVFYQRYLISFVDFVGMDLTVGDLRPLHVTRWIAEQNWGETSRNSAISTVQRVVNWAVKQGIIERSPLAAMEKPPRNRRESFVTPEQFDAILALVKDQAFRDLLTILWATGCRPQEARRVEARHFIPERRVWLFERVESKGKRKRRLVVLNDKAAEITARLTEQYPTGPIFRNKRGRPWTKDAINCRFHRLKKLGIKANAYSFRHGFATEALRRGVDSFATAKLMGHSDTKMLDWVYAHVDQDDEYLRTALKDA